MIAFPDWSDLGLGKLSEQTRWTWDNMLMEAQKARYYFDGDVFKQTVEPQSPGETDLPLLYPVGVNLVKMMCIAQADAMYGEWRTYPIQWAVRNDQEVSNFDRQAIDLATDILEFSNAGKMFWEMALDANVYGGSAMKISPSHNTPGHVVWQRVPHGTFFPVWDPDDADNLLEVYIAVPMTGEQAFAKFGYEAKTELVWRVEHWTRTSYENTLDGTVELKTYSGANPWGVVPFVYFPRLRMSSWWGDSLSRDLYSIQDELNERVADVGEAINYNAHPTRWGVNLPRDFNAENYPLGPNAMWNLGRAIGSNPPPQVGMLEAKAAVNAGVFEHIKFVYDYGRTSGNAPPIAFGEDNGGGQRSGVTLEIRMWPLLKAIRRSRAYQAASLRRALSITARILMQKSYSDVGVRTIEALSSGRVVPQFASVLPRDQSTIVDEVVKLLSTDPPSISEETAQMILGRGTGEVDRIRTMLDDKSLWKVHNSPTPAFGAESMNQPNNQNLETDE